MSLTRGKSQALQAKGGVAGASARPVVLKVFSVTDAAFPDITMDHLLCAFIFPYPLLVQSSHIQYRRKTMDQPGKVC